MAINSKYQFIWTKAKNLVSEALSEVHFPFRANAIPNDDYGRNRIASQNNNPIPMRKLRKPYIAAIEGWLERFAFCLSLSSDSFIQSLTNGTSDTDFSGCPIDVPEEVAENRNQYLTGSGSTEKRRQSSMVLFNAFLTMFHKFVTSSGFRSFAYGYAYGFLPAMTKNHWSNASRVFLNDHKESDKAIWNICTELAGDSGFGVFPLTADVNEFTWNSDKLCNIIEWATGSSFPYSGGQTIDGSWTSIYDVVNETLDSWSGIGSVFAGYFETARLNTFAWAVQDITMTALGATPWTADSCFYNGFSAESRVQYPNASMSYEATISIEYNYSTSSFDFNVSYNKDGWNHSYSDEAKWGYSEGSATGGDNGFSMKEWYTIESVRNALKEWYLGNAEYAFVSEYVAATYENASIPFGGQYARETGTMFSLGLYDYEALATEIYSRFEVPWYYLVEESGSCHASKTINAKWCDENDSSLPTPNFSDTQDFPCSFAVSNSYVAPSEYMYCIGSVSYEDNYGSDKLFNALKYNSSYPLKSGRGSAAKDLVVKYLSDIPHAFPRAAGQGLYFHTSAGIESWMDSFEWTAGSGGRKITNQNIEDIFYQAQWDTSWRSPNYVLLAWRSDSSTENPFADWAGLWWNDDSGGSPTSMAAEQSEVYGESACVFWTKSYSFPLGCRDWLPDFVMPKDWGASGAICLWIGAFDWAWKAISHN